MKANNELVARMREDLYRYQCLQQHDSSYAYAPQLMALQNWQIQRLAFTHKMLLRQSEYRVATQFVLNEVYGGIDLSPVATDIGRALPAASRLFSEKVLITAAKALELNALTGELDEAMVQMHFQELGHSTVTEQSYLEAYRACGHYGLRERQIELARGLGEGIDAYIASRMIYMGFKLAKQPARAAGLDSLYSFMQKGFDVLRPLGSASQFMDRITLPELRIVHDIKASVNNPFGFSSDFNIVVNNIEEPLVSV